jgi:hypothetical protein
MVTAPHIIYKAKQCHHGNITVAMVPVVPGDSRFKSAMVAVKPFNASRTDSDPG